MPTYAKYLSETSVNFRIPTTLDIDGIHYQGNIADRFDLLSALGYLQVEEADGEQPVPRPGYHLEPHYALDSENQHILVSYVEVADPPRNLSLSKRKLMNNMKKLGIWEQVKQFLVANGYWDDFEMSTTLDEQEEMMQMAITALKSAFQMSDEQVEEIIVNSTVD